MQRSTKSGLCLRGQEIWGNQGKKKVSIIKAFIDSISIQSHLLQEALPASPPPPAREGRQMPLSCTRCQGRALVLQYLGLWASPKQALLVCHSVVLSLWQMLPRCCSGWSTGFGLRFGFQSQFWWFLVVQPEPVT